MNASEREALEWWGALGLFLQEVGDSIEKKRPSEFKASLFAEFYIRWLASIIASEREAEQDFLRLSDGELTIRSTDGAEFALFELPAISSKQQGEFALEQHAALGAFLAASHGHSFEGWVDAGYEVRKLWRALVVELSKMPRESWPPFNQLKVVVS